MHKDNLNKSNLNKLSTFKLTFIGAISVLIGLLLFFFFLDRFSYYIYLKALGHVNLLKPFFDQSTKNAILSGVLLLVKYFRFLYQPRILIIIALIISFPFVRRWVRGKVSHKVQERPVLRKLYRLAPWIRAIILISLVAYYLVYGLSQQMGEKMAQENIALWNQYVERCDNFGASHVQTLTFGQKTYRCAYVIAVNNQGVLFFAKQQLHVFNFKTQQEQLVSLHPPVA